MNLNSTISISNSIFSEKVDNETIILDTKTNQYFNLSDFGKLIWDMLIDEKQVYEIYQELVEFTDVKPDQLENDILNFINSLEKLSLLEITN